MVLVLLLSGLSLGFAARVQELLEVSEAVSEAVAVKQDETVQGVTYDEPKDRTCTSTSRTFCESPAVWRGGWMSKGEFCCLQGHYTCNHYGITGHSRCNSPSAWTGGHCCTKVATTTTTTPQRLQPHNGGYRNGGYNEFRGKACKGRNELGSFQGSSVRTCQSKCDMDPKCVSFEWEAKRRLCQVSTSCTERYLAAYPHLVIYIKKYNSNTKYNKYISSAVQCDAVGSRIPRATDDGKTFRCLGGKCLPMRGRCNGVRNCGDGSDEVGCTTTYHLAPKGAATCDFGERVPKRDCLSAVKQLAPRPLGRPSLQEGQGGRCLDGSWGSVPTGCSAQTGNDWTGDWAALHKTGRCKGGAGWQQGVNKIYQLICQTTTTQAPTEPEHDGANYNYYNH